MPVRCYRLPAGSDSESLRRAALAVSPGLLVQAADDGAIANEAVGEMLAAQTAAAEASGNLLARKREVDLLLRLAATTQIAAALGTVGVKKGRPFVLIVSGEEDEVASAEAAVLPGAERLQSSELASGDLERVEKAALLNAERG